MKNTPYLMLPLAALTVSMLSGCANLGALMGQNQPALSPAAKAAAEMPLEKDPVVNTQDTYLALVRQMQSKSLWYASIAHLDALDKQWGASSDSRLMRADALRQVGQFDDAAPIYQSLLGGAKDGAARYGLGRVAAEQGDFPKAAQQMELARMANPVDPRLLTDLGYAYLRARNLNAARLPLMQAAQLNPEDAQANVNLSLLMMVSGQSEQAEEFMHQRKLDAETRQAVKEQASQWLQGAKQAAAEPAPQATGKVINVSRSEAAQPRAAVAKTVAPAAIAEPEQEALSVKKSAPESEVAQAPVLAEARLHLPAAMPVTAIAALPAAQVVMPQSVNRASGGGQWMVSGSSFDAVRPRHPGQTVSSLPQTYAYAIPAPVPVAAEVSAAPVAAVARSLPTTSARHQEMSLSTPAAPQQQAQAPVSVAKPEPAAAVVPLAAETAEPKVAAPIGQAIAITQEHSAPVRAVPAQRAEPGSQPPAPRQPTGPARSLQEGSVVMAAASPVTVRQVGSTGNKQMVQAMLPRGASANGLFFETPDEAASSKPTSATKAAPSERVWP
ncbi:MAG: tetratricopeptide repeat protein [Comamonas sp.]|jgi:Flp pilus assembly protein TadD|uniref:tetratricopeptide repeat protein n=1 Tax=Comamonas sp. TaxID=34028 RepID=UPI0028250190|nr:tetratricopeptide repeat protein [Comamonas sp.]MDR0216237.1 tetratricopeptide repeat protein [Comamonas sp.]